ncbi:hypothetical protein CRM22_004457 [Opisthorchis felineus]|uniref:Cytosol aminopeptidase domain-containing protein n=1 Tax=Opisthorchis felineus TaxID=147828 RepID=A0A4S2LWZ3_OPIFE|nr:hypothetical protein CRM22_004457 [Opisthorchis felineus]
MSIGRSVTEDLGVNAQDQGICAKTVPVSVCSQLNSSDHDCLVLVADDVSVLPAEFELITQCLSVQNSIVPEFHSGIHVIYCESLPSKRIVLSFTGSLDRDYDDIRRISEAACDGISHAFKIGSIRPLLALAPLKALEKIRVLPSWAKPEALCLSTLLGALHALYVPLEVREFALRRVKSDLHKSVKPSKATSLGWFPGTYTVDHAHLVHIAWCLEEGRRVCRDIGGSDPERMCASRIVDYIKAELSDTGVVVKTGPVDAVLYPLAAVVDRGSNERHRGAIVHLEYSGPLADDPNGSEVTNLFLIGKGIVYDTGGSDLKVGGIMATMHRDKCGAAAVVGFFKTAALLKPEKLKLHGSLAIVRNSIGSNAYVSDEIITSRAGLRVRVNNTDAEGRMVMTDLLCEAKEQALQVVNPHLMTFATLTGHVVLSYGPNYTGIVANGPSRVMGADQTFQSYGELLGEMHEISTLRREDFDAHKAQEDYADLINSARPVGGKRVRGHQSPAAFMIVASGLDSHMTNAEKPLPYTHFDIAGSQGPCPGIPTAVPLLTLASRYLLQGFWEEVSKL